MTIHVLIEYVIDIITFVSMLSGLAIWQMVVSHPKNEMNKKMNIIAKKLFSGGSGINL